MSERGGECGGPPQGTIPVYRYYNNFDHDHVYTTNYRKWGKGGSYRTPDGEHGYTYEVCEREREGENEREKWGRLRGVGRALGASLAIPPSFPLIVCLLPLPPLSVCRSLSLSSGSLFLMIYPYRTVLFSRSLVCVPAPPHSVSQNCSALSHFRDLPIFLHTHNRMFNRGRYSALWKRRPPHHRGALRAIGMGLAASRAGMSVTASQAIASRT